MMDIDAMACLSDGLAHQVFNAAGDDESASTVLAQRLRCSFPLKIRAIQHRHLEAPAPPPFCGVLHIHDRLAAWFGKQPSRPAAPFISGESVLIEHPSLLIGALRQAIISMRKVELEVMVGEPRAYLSPENESELIQLTIRELRHSPKRGHPLATTCCRALVFHHSRILNSLRRKLLELLSAVTATTSLDSDLSHRYVEAIRRVLSTYVLSEFVEWFPRQLVHLAGLAEKARREHACSHSPLVGEAMHYLDHRFTDPIGLQQPAAALHVSKEHLARRFKVETGMTVLERLNALRIEAAKEQLTHSRAPLKVIADTCGFGTLENFHRMFKRLVGIPPGAYRQKLR